MREVLIPPERGRIFDAKGRILADNQRILTVAIDWSVIKKPKDRNALFERLSGPLKVPVIDLQRRYEPCFGEPAIPKCTKGQRFSTLLPLPLKEDVDEDTVTYLKERSEDFPGIEIVEQWKRVYPYAPLASHVVGYLGPITKETAKQYKAKDYNTNELRRRVRRRAVDGGHAARLVGQAGLRGRRGRRHRPRAGRPARRPGCRQGHPADDRSRRAAVRRAGAGDQARCSAATCRPTSRCKTSPRTTRSTRRDPTGDRVSTPAPRSSARRSGSSTRRPRARWSSRTTATAQILAMASYPRFDNRWMGDIDGDKFDQLFGEKIDPATGKADPDKSVLVNRAVQGRYNLGSTIKPFVAWSAMHSGVIGPNEPYIDTGQSTSSSRSPTTSAQAACAASSRTPATFAPTCRRRTVR